MIPTVSHLIRMSLRLDFPKVNIKLGKVKKFGVNQIKNGAVGAIF